MSSRAFELNNTLATDPDVLHRRVIRQNQKHYDHEVELSPELRFPGDIPNPMIPHRAHSTSGSSPLSHHERISLAQARYDVDEFDIDE